MQEIRRVDVDLNGGNLCQPVPASSGPLDSLSTGAPGSPYSDSAVERVSCEQAPQNGQAAQDSDGPEAGGTAAGVPACFSPHSHVLVGSAALVDNCAGVRNDDHVTLYLVPLRRRADTT